MDVSPVAPEAGIAETVRAWFRDDPSRMTMMAARSSPYPSGRWSRASSTIGRSSASATTPFAS